MQHRVHDLALITPKQYTHITYSKSNPDKQMEIKVVIKKIEIKETKSHSHIAIVVRPPGRKTLCRSLVICKGFFRPTTPAVI